MNHIRWDNQRRVDLINQDLDGRLTEAEREELESLESRSDQYVDRLAPLPLESLRKLHDDLVTKAADADEISYRGTDTSQASSS
jgi:DNA-directed RNA polymerase subunit F